MKKILMVFGLVLSFSMILTELTTAKCVAPSNWPYGEDQEYKNPEVKTIFMGKVVSKKITRQGGGYKFLQITFKTKVLDIKKGNFPENGKIVVYAPLSTDLCGYYDKDFFSLGSYMLIFAKKNNGLNITDRYSLNRKFNDELVARSYLNQLAKINKTVKQEVRIETHKIFSMYYILFAGLLILLFYYLFARRVYKNKILKEDDELYYEDDGTMYFSTKGDEIEIRVKKDELNK